VARSLRRTVVLSVPSGDGVLDRREVVRRLNRCIRVDFVGVNWHNSGGELLRVILLRYCDLRSCK